MSPYRQLGEQEEPLNQRVLQALRSYAESKLKPFNCGGEEVVHSFQYEYYRKALALVDEFEASIQSPPEPLPPPCKCFGNTSCSICWAEMEAAWDKAWSEADDMEKDCMEVKEFMWDFFAKRDRKNYK